jgi:hypothetical protein
MRTAFMQLVLSNAQGELTPLERGMHALVAVRRKNGKNSAGKVIWTNGMIVDDYAAAVGRKPETVKNDIYAAEVFKEVAQSFFDTSSFMDCNKHLSEIHSAPDACWPPLAKRMIEGHWTATETIAAVKAVNAVRAPRGYEALFQLERLQVLAAEGRAGDEEMLRL